MADTQAREVRLGEVTLKKVRLSFPHLHEPSASVKDGPKKFRATFLIDPTTEHGKANHAAIKAAVRAVKAEVWKHLADKVELKGDRLCVKRGDDCKSSKTFEVYDGYAGMIALVTAADRQPPMGDRMKVQVPLNAIEQFFYGGCYVDAVVRFWGTDKQEQGGNGVFCALNALRFRENGTPFGAAPVDLADAFDDLDDEEGSEPAASGDDDLV